SNELSAVAAYRRLARLEKHPALSPLLQRIAQQETRHVAFYSSQARDRLEKSKIARKLTRFALTKAWEPVGSSISEPDDVKHVMGHLFAGDEGMKEVRRIDSNIARLPGMDGLTIVEDSLIKKGVAPARIAA
ncbi:MAG: ferritin-like domain-containing protein, partial [Microbacterium sp.]